MTMTTVPRVSLNFVHNSEKNMVKLVSHSRDKMRGWVSADFGGVSPRLQFPRTHPQPASRSTLTIVGKLFSGSTMPSQQPVEGTSTKLLSESPGWNALQTLKSCLSGRLVVFAPDRRPSRRPSRFENDVSFFEDDLGYIFNVNLVAVSLPEKDHSDMDSMALDVLESLNDIVSRDFVKLQEMGDIREFDPREDSSSKACKVTSFAKYKRISAMICCLQTHPEAHFSLVAGPDPTLFTLPSNGHGKVVKGRVKRWRAFLDRLAADAEISQGLQIISLQAIGIPTEELTDKEGDVLERRAGVVIDAMFREFRQLSCATVKTHEVKLRLSGLYTGPPMAFLEMFVSCCAGEKWHEAKCGSFP